MFANRGEKSLFYQPYYSQIVSRQETVKMFKSLQFSIKHVLLIGVGDISSYQIFRPKRPRPKRR